MTDQIDLVAIITPRKGQTDRFFDLFAQCAEHARANEPGTLRYRIHRGNRAMNDGAEELVVRETYENAAAMETHLAGALVKAMVREIEGGTLTENVKVIHVSPGAGYDRAKF